MLDILHVNIIFLSSDQIDTDMDLGHFAGLIFLQPWVLHFIMRKRNFLPNYKNHERWRDRIVRTE